MSVVYRGFELRAGQKLLMEFDADRFSDTSGRVVYTLTESDVTYHGVGEDEVFDIATHLGFDFASNEYIYPSKVTELAADENPISIEGLPPVQWADLEEGMTVVLRLRDAMLEVTLCAEDVAEAKEDGMFYPFRFYVADCDPLWLKSEGDER